MTRKLLMTLALGVVLLAVGCGPSQHPLSHGERIPAFSLADADGRQLSLPDELHGRVVLIHFWADWCALCLEELAAGKALMEAYGTEHLALVAINLEQQPQQVATLLERLDLNYPALFDRDGEVGRRYGVSSLPMSFLVDRQGRLRRRLLGAISTQQLEPLLRELF